jgi:hypothetical protein
MDAVLADHDDVDSRGGLLGFEARGIRSCAGRPGWGRGSPGVGWVRSATRVQRHRGSVDAQLVAGLVDDGQRDRSEGGESGVVVSGQADVVRRRAAGFGEGVAHAYRFQNQRNPL